MAKNNFPHSAHSSRRTRRHQQAPKKTKFFLLFICMLFLIGGSIYVLHTIQKDSKKSTSHTKKNHFKEQETALLERIRMAQKEAPLESTEHIETINDSQVLLYEPVKTEAIPQLLEIKNELATMIHSIKNERVNYAPLKIVGQVKMSKITEQLKNYQAFLTIYTWNQEAQEWSERTETGLASYYVNQKNNQPLSLTDLFTSEVNLLAIQPILQQKILDDSPDGNAIIDEILSMPNLSLNDTPFTYYPDKISLKVPVSLPEKKEVTLSYRDLLGYLNPEFVDPAIINEASPATLDPNKNYISLTFDDGPNPQTTPRILDILKEKAVKATFFMLGQNVVNNEAIVKRVLDEGHEVANHSYSHPQLTSIDGERVKQEVQNTDKAIYHATGKISTDFRPPYGAVNSYVAAIINKPIIQWSVDSHDWKSHNVNKIIQRINNTKSNGGILLMHDIHQETVAALPAVIDHLREDGYEIIPSKQLLGNKGLPMHMYFGSNDERPIQ